MTTYSLAELAHAAGVSTFAIRHYVRRGMLAPARRDGSASRYGDDHLAWLLAMKALRKRGVRGGVLASQLSTTSLEQLRVIAGLQAPTPARSPSERDVVEAAVCAAASALDVSPRGVRAALASALARLYSGGLTLEDAVRVLAAKE